MAAKVALKLKAVLLNPKVLLFLGIAALIIIIILGLFSACSGMATSVGQALVATSYLAEDEDLDDAVLLYTELTADLQLQILNIETDYPDFDEYILDIGTIGFDAHMLLAFLTAVYEDFTFADVEATIREIFGEAFTLEKVESVEIRTKMEEQTGTGVDEDGNEYEYTYEAEVEHEWHILTVTLSSQSLFDILADRMTADQIQHYGLLMQSRGLRQVASSPFAFNWLPFISSPYGWRIHPDTEVKDHCGALFVSVGQTVEEGAVIATVGNTGDSTNPHLHFEVKINGRHVNPVVFALGGGF